MGVHLPEPKPVEPVEAVELLDATYVRARLESILQDQDLSRYIL